MLSFIYERHKMIIKYQLILIRNNTKKKYIMIQILIKNLLV